MDSLALKLAECLLALLYELECAGKADVNEDFSIRLMEQVGAELQTLDENQVGVLLNAINQIAVNAADENRKAYLLELGENFDLSEKSI